MQKNFFNKDRKNKKMIIAISVSVAIIVIGLAVFCYFLFANEKENNAKNKAENAQEDPQAKIEEEKEEAKVQLPDLKASQYETDEITTGIDVSEFQGNIDWKAVADSGIDFAMIRVGYRGMKNGEIKEDACAKYNLQEASKNGLKIGAYFFSTAVTEEEAKEEAEWTKNLLSGYPVTYPVLTIVKVFKIRPADSLSFRLRSGQNWQMHFSNLLKKDLTQECSMQRKMNWMTIICGMQMIFL